MQKLSKFLFFVVFAVFVNSDAWALYTRARFTGPFHFTTCGTLGDPESPVVHMNIRYDTDFAPLGDDSLFTVVAYGNPNPTQQAACEVEPLGSTCLSAFPENQRAVLPNPREMRFIAHPALLNTEYDFALLAVSVSMVNGQFQLTHTRVEDIKFFPCPESVPAIQAGAGFTTPIGASTTVPGTAANFQNHSVVARWASEPMNTAIDTPMLIGVVAAHPQGVNRVEFQINGGPKITVTESSHHPETAIEGYWLEFDPSTVQPGTRIEIQALAIPNQGRSLALAGPLTNASSPSGKFSLVHFATQNLPRPTVYISESGSDVTGTGTETSPVATAGRAVQLLKAQNNNILSLATIFYDEGDYAFGAGSPGWWDPAHYPYGPLTITSKPGITDSTKVRFNDVAFNFAPHMSEIKRVVFTPEIHGPGIYDHTWPERATISSEQVDSYGPDLISRHEAILGGGLLYKASRETYSRGGLRHVNGVNMSIWDYHYESAGISYNDSGFVYGGRTENADQSRVDLPGTPPASENHGDIYHGYGLEDNIYARFLEAVIDIAQVQGFFVSTPKTGFAALDINMDLTKYEKLPPNIGGPAAPFVGNQAGMFIKDSRFAGASNIFGGAAAAPGSSFVVENTKFITAMCLNNRFSEDCSTNQTGAIYRNFTPSFQLRTSGNDEAANRSESLASKPGAPAKMSERSFRMLLDFFPSEMRGLLIEEFSVKKSTRCKKRLKRKNNRKTLVQISKGVVLEAGRTRRRGC